jgi:hypothetical protein
MPHDSMREATNHPECRIENSISPHVELCSRNQRHRSQQKTGSCQKVHLLIVGQGSVFLLRTIGL